MQVFRNWIGAALLGCALGVTTAQPAALAQQAALPGVPVITVDHGPNAAAQEAKHYVVLVSLDGFRYDYAKKYGAKNLLKMADDGASAPDGMFPSYPSITFPNHYTLVTGLYPEHHGIVGMDFYNADHTREFRYSGPAALEGDWWGGTPLWVLAEQQGMRSACFFWPGSEAPIDGVRPSYYLHYSSQPDDDKRVDQVLAWLKLPEAQRPHFITLYYPDVDHAGHQYGPDSSQVHDAVLTLDGEIGRLRDGIAALHLPVDLVVVSDHGMSKVKDSWITLDKYADLGNTVTAGAFLYPPDEATAQKIYDKLKSADPRFAVYRRADVPRELHYNTNAREGDPVVVPLGPYEIRAHAPVGRPDYAPNVGMHGLDPHQFPEMKAIFYAEGPDIRKDVQLKPFENIQVFPFITEILGLHHEPVDGNGDVLEPALVAAHPGIAADTAPSF